MKTAPQWLINVILDNAYIDYLDTPQATKQLIVQKKKIITHKIFFYENIFIIITICK